MNTKHLLPAVLLAGCCAGAALAQTGDQPVNDLPNPYKTVTDPLKMPEGRTWGSTSAIGIDRDAKSVWVAERCGANSCLNSPLDPVLHFGVDGKVLKTFGSGMMIFPHGFFVDREGNIWVTDGQDDAPRPERQAGGAGAPGSGGASGTQASGPRPGVNGPLPGATKGHQVFKFSPDGKLLMTLGKKGGAADPDYFYQPNAVYVMDDGTIFVAEGHSSQPGAPARILKFSKDGKLIKSWGKMGTGPGEFDQPHALAMDSKGRLFVGDRNNNRIQIFDQDGKYLAEWKQFGRPSGIWIDRRDDTMYVADSESWSVARNHDGWLRGTRIGSAKDGSVKYFIPDPDTRHRPEFTGTSAAEGITVDPAGNIYGAEVGPKDVKKYVKSGGPTDHR
jgi:sugar lactone lactonase YvrE